MSCTELFIVTNKGSCIGYEDYRNSHRGAAMVWNNLYKEFCGDYIKAKNAQQGWAQEFPLSLEDNRQVWKLFKDEKIPRDIRIVLGSTFDYVILKQENFEDFHKAVEVYAEWFPCGTLLQQANDIVSLKRRKILGVCWNQTSVCSMWYGRGNRHYNIFKQKTYPILSKMILKH